MDERFLYNIKGLSLEYFNELVNSNVWKAFAVIHAGIEHQMKITLTYYGDKIASTKNDHSKRWKFIEKKTFSQSINDLYILEAIGDELWKKLTDFNTKRNTELGHMDPYAKTVASDEDIKIICLEGIEIAKKLDIIIRSCFFKD